MNNSLFATLYKYSTGQDENEKKENYLTTVFVFILNRMLHYDKATALELLGVLCGDDSLFSDDEKPLIEPHKVVLGTGLKPDITIKGHNARVFIEVKWNTRAVDGQLKDYKRLLRRGTKVPYRRLRLLTKFPEATSVLDNKCKTLWADIYRKLDSLDVRDRVNEYILGEFKKYLKEEGMPRFEKIDDVYSDGVRAFFNLWQMAKGATDKALEQECKKYIDSDFVGCISKDKAFYTGIYFDDPDKLVFDFDEGRTRKRIKDKRRLNIEGVKLEEEPSKGYQEKATYYYSWKKQLDRSFFSLGKEQQFEVFHKFFKRCLDAIDKASRLARK